MEDCTSRKRAEYTAQWRREHPDRVARYNLKYWERKLKENAALTGGTEESVMEGGMNV